MKRLGAGRPAVAVGRVEGPGRGGPAAEVWRLEGGRARGRERGLHHDARAPCRSSPSGRRALTRGTRTDVAEIQPPELNNQNTKENRVFHLPSFQSIEVPTTRALRPCSHGRGPPLLKPALTACPKSFHSSCPLRAGGAPPEDHSRKQRRMRLPPEK